MDKNPEQTDEASSESAHDTDPSDSSSSGSDSDGENDPRKRTSKVSVEGPHESR